MKKKGQLSLNYYMGCSCRKYIIFWILYSGISEHFQGTTKEKLSYITLIGLSDGNTLRFFRPIQ